MLHRQQHHGHGARNHAIGHAHGAGRAHHALEHHDHPAATARALRGSGRIGDARCGTPTSGSRGGVDAAEKRGFNGTREAIAELRNRGTIAKGTMVIVQVGTNGPISVAQYEAIIAELPTTDECLH